MRVFYYCDINITGTGNQHFWEVILGNNSEKRAYYGQLPFTPPLDITMNKKIPTGSFNTDDIYRQMVTNYRDGSGKTFVYKTWNCFDLDMSAYSETNFAKSSDEIAFNLHANKIEAVSLESKLEGKIEGTFDFKSQKLPASSAKGFFGDLTDVIGLGSGIIKGVFGLYSGKYDTALGSINTVAGAMSGMFGSVKGYMGKEKEVYKGNVDFHLTGIIDTQGYITENGLATDIPTFRIPASSISSDTLLGEGVWNLKTTPILMAFDRFQYNNTFNVTMLDPDSIELVLREDIKQKATNIQLETVWGYYEFDNSDDRLENDKNYGGYRAALGLSEYDSSDHWWVPIREVIGEDVYQDSFTVPLDKAEINILDKKVSDFIKDDPTYSHTLFLKIESDYLPHKFTAFPYSDGLGYPELVVVYVRLRFELNEKEYVYTRRYFPKFAYYRDIEKGKEKIESLLKKRKERKNANWLINGVSYPVTQSELENLYNLYYSSDLSIPDGYTIDSTYKD